MDAEQWADRRSALIERRRRVEYIELERRLSARLDRRDKRDWRDR